MNTLLMGTAAGAVGTVALNLATYLDMVLRGRPSSEVPAKTAEAMVAGAGVSLSGTASGQSKQEAEQRAQARRSGLGALLGYAAGLGVGALYGAIRPQLGDAPVPLTGLALGAAAMAASDLPSVLTGTTDPREWGTSGWLADVVPHLAYGLVAALAYEAFTAGPLGRRSSTRAEYLSAVVRHSSAGLRR